MKKILVSWIATDSDFEKGTEEISETKSPNFLMHKYFFDKYDKHFIVSSESEIVKDKKLQLLIAKLKKDFPSHPIEPLFADLKDINDAEEAKRQLDIAVYPHVKNCEVYIYIAAGTTSIRLAWFAAQVSWQEANTHLIQFKTPRNGRIARIEDLQVVTIDLAVSSVPVAIQIKQQSIDSKKGSTELKNEEYKITPSMIPMYEKAAVIARSDSRVLIFGETGTGKEHFAKYIHENSEKRRKKPFIAQNCGAIAESLLQSILFGHKKNTFTDAKEDKKGLFEEANGGTLFLDEIGEIDMKMQQSLLRVLEVGKVTRVGDHKTYDIDVQIIAATNKDLLQMCIDGTFRWDLYYRLAVVEVELLPLRQRSKEDIGILLDFYLQKIATKYGTNRPVLALSKEARSFLLNYPYYGNVRELINIVENIYVNHEAHKDRANLVSLSELPIERMNRIKKAYEQELKAMEETGLNPRDSAEKKVIIDTLSRTNFNITQTAKDLGFAYNTLKDKIKKYQIAV